MKRGRYGDRARPLAGTTLEARVKEAVRRVWAVISADAYEMLRDMTTGEALEVAVELCLDADRPVTEGGLSKEDYTLICGGHHHDDAERWATEALRGYL